MAIADPNDARRYDSAEVIEELGASVAGEYHALEATMIGMVAAALRTHGPNDPATARRLARDGRRLAADLHPRSTAQAVITIAALYGSQEADRDAGANPRVRIRVSAAVMREAGSFADELSESLAGMEPGIASWMPRAYRTASGILTTQEAAHDIAARYLARGIPGKRYADGRWMPIGSYAEMVARTTIHQASIVGHTLTQMEHGLNLSSIVTALDSCRSCASNRGKVWSVDGTPAGTYTYAAVGGGTVTIEVAGPLAAASNGTHFRGPNCRCQVVTVHPGLPVTAGPEHSPTAEKERDRQRSLERDIRRWKARQAAALTDTDAAFAKRRVTESQKRMRAFLTETGRNRRGYREQLGWATGPSVPAPASPVPVSV